MLEPGEVGDHRLEVEQRLEPALADLGLVRRVRGVPGRVLEHVALDHRRRDRAVVAHADQAGARPVAVGERAQLAEHVLDRARAGQRRGRRRAGSTPGTVSASSSSTDARADDGEHQLLLLGGRGRCGGGAKSATSTSSSSDGRADRDSGGTDMRKPPEALRSTGVLPPLSWVPESFVPCTDGDGRFPVGEDRLRGADTCFPATPARTVRWPERFRGGCSFGGSATGCAVARPTG